MIEFKCEHETLAKMPSIKVVGVGGAGGNTVNSLIDSGCQNVYCIAANSDAQALELSHAQQTIQLGVKSTKGLGTGANPDLGRHAAEEDLDKIMESLSDADIVFLTAGMGGGTGSGALPVIARALKKEGILTIAIVTKPFTFEGKRRSAIAEEAIAKLKPEVDSLIVIPNQRLLEIVDANVSMMQAFSIINDMLGQAVRGIADIIIKPGYINVDFADVKAVMYNMGMSLMGTGRATGEDRALTAALNAISSPLLEDLHMQGARGVLLNISGGSSMRLHEINEAASVIYEQAAEDAHIILGAVIDEQLGEELVVTVIATGFETREEIAPQMQEPAHVQPAVKEQPNLTSVQTKEVENKTCEKSESDNAAVKNEPSVRTTTLVSKEDLLDVPTFLRRQEGQQAKSE